jgi:hypothetical protein
MRLEAEGGVVVENPAWKEIEKLLKKLRSYGPISFASLTNADGSHVQVAGGGVVCMVEWFDAGSKKHFRAWQELPISVFPDGTHLVFSGGSIPPRQNEWFKIGQVLELFRAFSSGRIMEAVHWREITETLSNTS